MTIIYINYHMIILIMIMILLLYDYHMNRTNAYDMDTSMDRKNIVDYSR